MTADTDTEILEAPQANDTAAAPQATMAEPELGTGERDSSSADPDFAELTKAVDDAGNIDMLLDVDLMVTVELGRAQLKLRDVLNLSCGSVIELSRLTSEAVDILVNGALLATGEVVVIDDRFAVRINKLLDRVERLKRVV
jgi:flagellar motor switch protein FliN/FliY